MLKKAEMRQFEQVCGFYKEVCDAMNSEGLKQWEWGRYPTADRLKADFLANRLYLYEENEEILAAVVLEDVQEDEYLPVNWLFGVHPGVFHRFAVSPETQGKGIGKKLFPEMERILVDMGCDSMRFDTQCDNQRAVSLYDKISFRRAGIIHWDDDPTDYICFEKPLTDSCPLLPLRMHPAFRGGKLTPWGGDKLRTVFGKQIKDVPTGESIEVSCIPGLESTDDMGVTLSELVKKFGSSFAGKYAKGQFPLLLKLIDANDSLSVQVHPDDEYAAQNEFGKLGKTEAWLILDAPEGSQLVYGLKQGTSRQQLEKACAVGKDVEGLLNFADVHPGDVCFIPAGCVHAIGKGITLYEIQQSSDITYRFYDWDRTDKDGNKRELHVKKAIDVTDLTFALSPVPSGNEAYSRVLDEKYFSLDLFNVTGNCTVPEIADFGLLTALTDGIYLSWDECKMTLSKGESVYLPSKCVDIVICGKGKAALSMPK